MSELSLSPWIVARPMPSAPHLVRQPDGVQGSGNTGRRGTPIVFRGVAYASWAEASKKTGLTKATIRWRLQGK